MQQQDDIVAARQIPSTGIDSTLQKNRLHVLEEYKQREINVDSTANNDAVDEYFIPLEPNHALALTMNFPQFPEPILSTKSTPNSQTGLCVLLFSSALLVSPRIRLQLS